MSNSENELEEMKRFPLPNVLADLGYAVNARKSSRQSCFMVNPQTGMKLVVSLNTNGHYRFFPIGSGQGGTVIDALKLHGMNLGQARVHMRPYLSGKQGAASPAPAQLDLFKLEPIDPVLNEELRTFTQTATPLPGGRHAYLNNERGLPASLLARPHFAKAVFIDRRSNAVFPHRDSSGGIVGAELRNTNFHGQMKGGRKTLWFATPGQEERNALVIAEGTIDALSYACLNYAAGTCYMSTGGTFSPLQSELIERAFRKLPSGGHITAAVDNDDAGDAIADKLRTIFNRSGRSDLGFEIDQPPSRGDDWNDHLRQTLSPER